MATNVTLKRVTNADGTTTDIHPTTDWAQIESKPSTFTPTSHTHGNITNGGEITASATIATGDHLVIADNSSGNDLTTSSITFDTSNTTDFLRKDGTFATVSTSSGDITGVTAGTGLSGGGTSGSVTLNVDLSELTDMTADVNGLQDELILLDNGADRKKLISEIKLSQFNNDSGFTSNVGDITGVTAGSGLTGGGSSGTPTLNVGAGTGISVAADSVSVNASILNNTHTTHSASNLAIGWYTIATVPGNRGIARFGIRDVASSRHQSVIFYAAHHYGNNDSNTLTVLHQSSFGTTPFRYIRIKEGGTYDGAALQVYIDGSGNSVDAYMLGDNFQSSGWTLKDWVADATDPGNVSNYSSFVERGKIDLDNISQGGMATTGEIYAGGNTTQYRVFHDNYHPNADKWTTARTITLGGDLVGNVSLDGSANVTLSAAVANDSHTHDGRYYTESEVNTYLAAKAPLASPALTGNPTAPTPTTGDDDTSIATTAFVTTAIDNLVNGASASFDTLKEIQDAMATDTELSNAINGLTIGNGTQTISVGTGLDGGGSFTANQTGNSSISINLDLSEFTDMTADVVGSQDELILLDSGAERRKLISEIKLSQFNNDAGFVTTDTNTQLSTEQVQDIVGAMVSSNTESNMSVTYDDANGKLNFSNSAPDQTVSLTGSGATSVSGTYPNFTISSTDTNTNTQLSTEQVQDIVGGMVSSNSESGVAVTYDDTNGKLNFNVSDPTITLTGDVTGSATMTNLGNVSITATVADDSHNHTIANIDNLQTSLNAKQDSFGDVSTTILPSNGQVLKWNSSASEWQPGDDNNTDTNTTYSAGSGLSLSGTTFSHSDTSTQASVNNSGVTFIQDVTLDTYGHITALGSSTITNNISGSTFQNAYAAPGGGTNTGVLLYGDYYGWHTRSIGSQGQVLRVSSVGTPVWEDGTWTLINSGLDSVYSSGTLDKTVTTGEAIQGAIYAVEIVLSSTAGYTRQILQFTLGGTSTSSFSSIGTVLYSTTSYNRPLAVKVRRQDGNTIEFGYGYSVALDSTPSFAADFIYIGRIWKIGDYDY
jgi:hypothetical protein